MKGPALNLVLYYMYTKKNEYNSDKEWSRLYYKLSRLMNKYIDLERESKWYNIFGTIKSKKNRIVERYKQNVSRVETKRKKLNIN